MSRESKLGMKGLRRPETLIEISTIASLFLFWGGGEGETGDGERGLFFWATEWGWGIIVFFESDIGLRISSASGFSKSEYIRKLLRHFAPRDNSLRFDAERSFRNKLSLVINYLSSAPRGGGWCPYFRIPPSVPSPVQQRT